MLGGQNGNLKRPHGKSTAIFWLLCLIPFFGATWVWLSALSFVPVPWPDDSAFYFVAKELFQWPPRWVMLPQAPFEPTYRIFNFNTMPLYPILIGIGRELGIDGSFGIKFWPLVFWAATGSIYVAALLRAGMPILGALAMALVFALDPIHRWGSVLVRPESLVAFCGTAIVLGLTFGFPERLRARGLWDPIAALLAIAAYSHFNAIHLLFPVVLALALEPRTLIRIASRTLLYLSPWLLVVAARFNLFVHQMKTQWTRLAIHNDWLDSFSKAVSSLISSYGSPESWPGVMTATSIMLWIAIIAALAWSVVVGLGFTMLAYGRLFGWLKKTPSLGGWSRLTPAAAWVLGAVWLWDSKPEVWFIYYIHIATWCFVGIAGLALWNHKQHLGSRVALAFLATLTIASTGIFAYVDFSQAIRLGNTKTWNWTTYRDYVDCVDQRLSALERDLRAKGIKRPDEKFSAWFPTFPDITVQLSLRHPDWDLTRTNDFWERAHLAVAHGHAVDAVVVTEMLHAIERELSAPASQYPEIISVWMTWREYFLNRLWNEPGWKPNRYICQRGRWQAFLFMN